ncbi:hypothetical protein BTVI_53288 [Pitangus sulphuratus]|nr:hypothetical protein BTVI_53288 [Pitangus sulphuratus]
MIKGTLASAPTPELLDYTKPFNLYVHEQKRIASGGISQKLVPNKRLVAYYSMQLDRIAAGAPVCIKSVAAAATRLERSGPLILGHPVTVYIPHEVETLLKQYATQALSPQQTHRYELILLIADNLALKRCNTLNPTTLMPLPDDEEHHQCERVMNTSNKPQADLTDAPLQNPDLVLFVDSLSYYLHGQQWTGYAVVSQGQVIEATPLPTTSAQGAELVALPHAAYLGKGKWANIYTDSRYAFGCLRVCYEKSRVEPEEGGSVLESECACERGVEKGTHRLTGATRCEGTPVLAVKVSGGACVTP